MLVREKVLLNVQRHQRYFISSFGILLEIQAFKMKVIIGKAGDMFFGINHKKSYAMWNYDFVAKNSAILRNDSFSLFLSILDN